MMFKVQTINSRPEARGQRRRRLAATASALALTVLLAGNVAARQLARDDGGSAALVTPKLDSRSVAGLQFKLKLATTAGYRILVFG
jgi:hypothetical protein